MFSAILSFFATAAGSTPSSVLISSSAIPYLPKGSTNGALTTALTVSFGVIGAFAFLMVTVSGLRYVLSGGDPQKITRARNGIIYSLVGVAVAIAAEAIVNFVVLKT
jgi:hypothetical protein